MSRVINRTAETCMRKMQSTVTEVLIKFIQTDDVVNSTLARTWQSAVVLCSNRNSYPTLPLLWLVLELLLNIQPSSTRYGADHLVDLRPAFWQKTDEDFDG